MVEHTVALLIYRSLSWLNFCLSGLEQAINDTEFKVMIVANDPEPIIENDPRVTHIYRNSDPNEFYINRVYRAWNYCVEKCDTKYITLINSDMYVSDYWLDELVAAKTDRTLPCSLLVESGRLRSAMPEYVRNFGLTAKDFKASEFKKHADLIRSKGVIEPGRLFMPVLFTKEEFQAAGGYPEGNPNGMSGDLFFFNKFKELGYQHITCLGSVVAHTQLGEQKSD